MSIKDRVKNTLMIMVVEDSERYVAGSSSHIQYSSDWRLFKVSVYFGRVEVSFITDEIT